MASKRNLSGHEFRNACPSRHKTNALHECDEGAKLGPGVGALWHDNSKFAVVAVAKAMTNNASCSKARKKNNFRLA